MNGYFPEKKAWPLTRIERNNPLARILGQMHTFGAIRFYAKLLAPNDNSKNQVYLGGDFGALNIIPHGEIQTDASGLAGAVRDRGKADVIFFWIDEAGLSEAPSTQLILYPKYPEVRMSGFLKGAKRAPRDLMVSRDEGRVLIFGICPDARVFGCVVSGDSSEAAFLSTASDTLDKSGVFIDLQSLFSAETDGKTLLLRELKRIWEMGWIPSQKLGRNGEKLPYKARNGGGYTLEAELGVTPNGYAEPDFHGWEIKQFGVRDFKAFKPKSPVTLLTPEPTGGVYKEEGLHSFVTRYGYPDKNGVEDRMNFGGVYRIGGSFNKNTGVKLNISGFDPESGKITDLSGAIFLTDTLENIAASWRLTDIIKHWNRKHAKAAYVPSISQTSPISYRYGPKIEMCEGTDVLLLISAFARGEIYYDPGIKIENYSHDQPVTKKRSQFRTKHTELTSLYKKSQIYDLTDF